MPGSLVGILAGVAVIASACRPTPPPPASTATTSSTTTPTTATTTTVPPLSPYRLPYDPYPIAGCEGFDRDSVLHSVVGPDTDLKVHGSSQRWLGALMNSDPRRKLHVAIASEPWQGSRPGTPINIVDHSMWSGNIAVMDSRDRWNPLTSPRALLTAPMPLGSTIDNLPVIQIEGAPNPWAGGDRHAIVIDPESCTLYEYFVLSPSWNGGGWWDFWAEAATKLQLGPGAGLEPSSGVTAGGLPMLGAMVTVDEVDNDQIDHLISACSNATAAKTQPEPFVWPARASDGGLVNDGNTNDVVPMGSRLRLTGDAFERVTTGTGRFTGQSLSLAKALRTHGIMILDTCYNSLTIGGENATGWDDANLGAQLGSLELTDFEFIDTAPMRPADGSWRVSGGG